MSFLAFGLGGPVEATGDPDSPTRPGCEPGGLEAGISATCLAVLIRKFRLVLLAWLEASLTPQSWAACPAASAPNIDQFLSSSAPQLRSSQFSDTLGCSSPSGASPRRYCQIGCRLRSSVPQLLSSSDRQPSASQFLGSSTIRLLSFLAPRILTSSDPRQLSPKIPGPSAQNLQSSAISRDPSTLDTSPSQEPKIESQTLIPKPDTRKGAWEEFVEGPSVDSFLELGLRPLRHTSNGGDPEPADAPVSISSGARSWVPSPLIPFDGPKKVIDGKNFWAPDEPGEEKHEALRVGGTVVDCLIYSVPGVVGAIGAVDVMVAKPDA
mmetsp:Transcript_14729/g.22899  ORF Transcript_14729/g.22899 Transcript_14729/m.22899 type:complete len:323 (-) Transcript_14729:235-1203(-)